MFVIFENTHRVHGVGPGDDLFIMGPIQVDIPKWDVMRKRPSGKIDTLFSGTKEACEEIMSAIMEAMWKDNRYCVVFHDGDLEEEQDET
jgi:hypothetical protein